MQSALNELMGIRDEEKPSDFPSLEELFRKTNTLSKNVRNERGLRNLYFTPHRYEVVVEAVVRENEKVRHDNVPILEYDKLIIVPETEEEDFPLQKQFKTKMKALRPSFERRE